MILSIICPTYNEERYIAQTLESFTAQQYHSFDLEILICDGMSTDLTREIVQDYSARFPAIRLINNPARKTPYAFNAGLQAARMACTSWTPSMGLTTTATIPAARHCAWSSGSAWAVWPITGIAGAICRIRRVAS